MEEEYSSLLRNNTWDLVHLPKGETWFDVPSVDYTKTFAPITKMNSICLTLAIDVAHGWVLHQMDVKSAFLQGDFDEEIIWSSHRASSKILP
ncbi:hypothetical protein SUGI_0328140 [Cryptomeria japonica]|nr:hypothetical protein SUGI_0328140 [Cryptomeria japonica]